MRKILLILILLLTTITPTVAHAAQSELPTVHTVLFWSNGCPYCTQVLTDTLPPMQEKYASRLSILLVEIVSLKDIENLYRLGATLGLAKEQVSVPFLLIDRTALIGVKEIQDKLPGLIERFLSAGGLAYADVPPLNEMLAGGISFTSFNPDILRVPQAASDTQAIGNVLAWIVMALMIAALAFSIVTILRAFNGRPLGKLSRKAELAIPILSIIGLGVSIYLSYVEVTNSRAICGPVGDCNAVQSSPYAKLFGVIPIGLAGSAGYIAILAVWLWQRYRSDTISRIAGPGLFAMALFGTLFSVYLTYLELFVIHAVCIWCLSSAVIITALMLLNLPPITQWLAISEEEELSVE